MLYIFEYLEHLVIHTLFASLHVFRWSQHFLSLNKFCIIPVHYIRLFGQSAHCLHDRTAWRVWAPPPPGASLWRHDVTRPRRLLGWRIRGDGDDGSVLERDAVKLASARIWLMFIWSRFICCSVIARASGEPLAPNFSSLLSLVSPPVVVVPRCVLTEASALGSALHLITTKTFAGSCASSAS